LSIFTDNSIALCEAASAPLVSAGGKTSLEREISGHHTLVKGRTIPVPPPEKVIDIPLRHLILGILKIIDNEVVE